MGRGIRFFLGAVLAALLLAGCAANEPPPGPELPAESPVRIVFANKSINSYFYIIVNAALEKEAESRGWEYELVVSDYDSVKQNNQLINLMAGRPDAIIINPINSDTLTYGIRVANKQNIPLCVVDTPASEGQATLTVSFDNYLAGRMAAEEIVARLVEKYGEPRGTVYEANNDQSSRAWALRKQGFDGVLARYPDIRLLAEDGFSDPDIICRNLSRVLESQPVDAVHCSSDHQSRGLVKALKDSGQWRPVGEEGHVILVTIDGDPSSVLNIREGYCDATIVQDAILYGELTVRLLDEYILADKPLPEGEFGGADSVRDQYSIARTGQGHQVLITPYVLDRQNADDPAHWGNVALHDWKFQYK